MAFYQEQTTDTSGLATFTDVPVGTGYTLEQSEETVPSGYVRYVNTDFDVTEGMLTTPVTLAPIEGNDLTLSVIVLDAVAGDPVEGSLFSVYADEAQTMLLAQFESSDEVGFEGTFSVPHLVGATGGRDYYIVQDYAPEGYAMSDDITVTVTISTTPDLLTIINPITTDVEVSVQDSNYPNIVFNEIDVILSNE